MKTKTLVLAVAMLAIACHGGHDTDSEKMADIEQIEGRIGKDWAEMSKGLEGFDLIRARLKNNRVKISHEMAVFYLKSDVAEAIYHQMGGEPKPEGAGRLDRVVKSLSQGGLWCAKENAAKDSKRLVYTCEMFVDLKTGVLHGVEKGLKGFGWISTRLKDNRVTISQERAIFYLKDDVAETIYNKIESKAHTGGTKLLSEGENVLVCVKVPSEKSEKTKCLCWINLDLKTGRLNNYGDDENEEFDEEDLNRWHDEKGSKFPRLPTSVWP
ncbi:MAG: hypothetical protein LBI68_08400 [Azoarcus sp.]|jgi:hypothetical protein|nr:hypothetical protein [Azoarcus sp.]